METNEGRVYFALDGDDFDPDDVTEFLGLQPTSVRRKGSRAGGKLPTTSSWEISTETVVGEYIDIYDMVADLVAILAPKKSVILQARERFNLSPRLEVVLWLSMNEAHSTPAIGFDAEAVTFLGEIGALIDIDTYKH